MVANRKQTSLKEITATVCQMLGFLDWLFRVRETN